MKDRNKNQQLVNDFQEAKLLKAMCGLAAENGYRLGRNDSPPSYVIRNIGDRLRSLRQAFRSGRENTAPKPAKREAEAIKGAISYLFDKRRFSYELSIGSPVNVVFHKRSYRSKAEITVGYMWHRTVYLTFLRGDRLVTRNIFPLKAEEYTINVKSIRLFKAKVWDIGAKKIFDGWIGQSALGYQKCAFKKDRSQAIAAALAFASDEISKNLKVGEKI